ncbi:iron ABC transporter permease [Corynebacterium sp.]|uniref:FecCD family ABC transporter permease n=1 Tax=Corynebacterium sp. TaxID=1720 RepID=UPI0026DD6623|nr:iron ABC transporter permease [Corynebacterium sp.]MDO5077098.1 iron ABC transporter permease [Corynebacterium sp.]
MRKQRHPAILWIFGILAIVAATSGSLFLGAASLSWVEVWGAVTHKTGLFISAAYPEPSLLRQSILFELRIPRILMGVIVGGALAVAGAALQAITRNDLAEPYLLGVSSGASTGAVVVIVLVSAASFGGSAAFGLTGGAALGALASFGLLMALLKGSGFSSTRVVLTGVLVGQLFSALTSLILMARGAADSVRGVMFWLLGALGASRWDTLTVVALVCTLCSIVLWAMSRYLDCLSFGDDTAESMGVPVARVRSITLITVALLTGATVSSVGAIGFIGLIVPHAVRMVIGPAHAQLIPVSALLGSAFLVITDALARTAFNPQEVPVGVFTAIIGVPMFFLILKRGQRL